MYTAAERTYDPSANEHRHRFGPSLQRNPNEHEKRPKEQCGTTAEFIRYVRRERQALKLA